MPTIAVVIDTDELEAPDVQVPRALKVATSIITAHQMIGLPLRVLDGAPVELADEYADYYVAGRIEVRH